MRWQGARATAVAAVAYGAAIAVLAWPLPRVLGSHLVDPGDAWSRADLHLIVWVLAWVAHAVVADPSRLFDGNIFYPAPDVLASSEHLLGLTPLAAPVFGATGNAVLTYNATIVVVVGLSALGAYLIVKEWTDDGLAAWLAGAAFAFAPLNVMGWARLHVTAVHLFPLVLLFAWRAMATPRWSILAALAVVTAVQLLSGVYVAFELLVLLLGAVPMLCWQAWRHKRTGASVLAAFAVSALPLVPVALVYVHARRVGVLPPDVNAALALTGNVPASALAAQLQANLGWPLLAAAAVGVVSPAPRSDSAAIRVGLLCIALTGFAFALGPFVPGPYALAARFIPGFSGMRLPMRFLVVPLLALSIAAGLGTARMGQVLRPRLGGRLVAIGMVLACALVVLARRPEPYELIAARPLGAHQWLAAHGDGRPILELPVMNSPLDGGALLQTTRAMVASTLHWQPLINGYSGYPPASDRLLMTLAQRLPDPEAFDALCRLVAPGWLVVHGEAVAGGARTLTAGLPVEEVARFGSEVVLRVTCPVPPSALAALRRQLADGDDGRTLDGAVRGPLDRNARQGGLAAVDVPARFAAGLHAWMWVRVENRSVRTWHGWSAWPTGTVGLQVRWRDPTSGAIVYQHLAVPLGVDLAPGQAVRAQAESQVPPPGSYVLEIGLVEIGSPTDARWFEQDADGTNVLRQPVESVAFGSRS